MDQKTIEVLSSNPKSRLLPAALGALAKGERLAVLIEVSSVAALCQGIAKSSLAGLQANSAALPAGWKEIPSVLSSGIVRAELGAEHLAAMIALPAVVSVEEDHEIKPHAPSGGSR